MSQPAAFDMHCHILDLPNEILEDIFSLLLPSTEQRNLRYWPKTLRDELRRSDAWRSTCTALRLTCRRFSQVRLACAALFHDFYLYPVGSSLQSLKELSESGLADHVRRVVFMRPQFSDVYVDRDSYYDALAVALDVPRFTDDQGDGRIFLSELAQVRQRMLERHPEAELQAAHEAYLKGLDDQQDVFNSERYVYEGARLLAGFPGITSVILCGGNGNVDGVCRATYLNWSSATCETFLQKRYPLARIKTGYDFYGGDCGGEFFVHSVFRVLSLARLRPRELACTQGVMLTSKLNLRHKSGELAALDLSRLRCLDVTLSAKDDLGSVHGQVDTLLPILEGARLTLEKLMVRATVLEQRVTQHAMDEAMALSFPSLRYIHLHVPRLSVEPLIRFVRCHPDLLRVDLQEQRFSRGHWTSIFKVLCQHKPEGVCIEGIIKREPHERPPKFRTFRVSTVGEFEGNIHMSWLPSLERFIRGEADWNPELTNIFGPMY